MKDPRNWSLVVVAAAIALGLALTTISCANHGSGDDDDSGPNLGTDIHGLFTVSITTAADSCEASAIGATADWILEIKQSSDFSKATVYRQQTGAHSTQEVFFKGKVYGNTVVLLETTQTTIGDTSCVQVKLRDYRLTVGGASADAVAGQLYDDTFYLGTGCDSSVQDCTIEQAVAPIPADDDTTDDDATDDDTTT
jgi:hypothetical protein